ncbi:tetratricopeptide repeat protein [Microbulbifer sp. OS29]|uniref:Tetratricopeptide repeat protein n=1 Tax=Microbulbifer okhotskensis TaxID=2926617 RepID=A0A9X2EP66_9GAMM|nr:tetratricopeptide repeat protein [Microbulbifer okhotskensis]MCO1333188.1 tetratricopeptide repeat protein [Microbulbifer okhotskensis]
MHKHLSYLLVLFYSLLGTAVLVTAISLTANPWQQKSAYHSPHAKRSLALIAQAEAYARSGNYSNALPLYEKAISALSDYPSQQQALRYRYGIVLNAFSAQMRPDLYPLARAQFQSVLNYLDSGADLPQSVARVQSAMAHTYHQQAATEKESVQQAHLLRSAYLLYKGAIDGLNEQGEWQNLAITYFNLGQVCEWQGNLEEAIAWLEKTVQLDLRHKLPDLQEDSDYLASLRGQVEPILQNPETAL